MTILVSQKGSLQKAFFLWPLIYEKLPDPLCVYLTQVFQIPQFTYWWCAEFFGLHWPMRIRSLWTKNILSFPCSCELWAALDLSHDIVSEWYLRESQNGTFPSTINKHLHLIFFFFGGGGRLRQVALNPVLEQASVDHTALKFTEILLCLPPDCWH